MTARRKEEAALASQWETREGFAALTGSAKQIEFASRVRFELMAQLYQWAVVDEQCSWWVGAPEEDPAQLAAALFAPAAWATRARVLHDKLQVVTDALDAGDDDALPSGFVVGAAALQHARRDPLLPPSLLAPDWPGADLRAAYRRFQTAFAASLTAALAR